MMLTQRFNFFALFLPNAAQSAGPACKNICNPWRIIVAIAPLPMWRR
jgi:hypothetical protein